MTVIVMNVCVGGIMGEGEGGGEFVIRDRCGGRLKWEPRNNNKS